MTTFFLESFTIPFNRYCQAYARPPKKHYSDSAGYDLSATESKVLRAGERLTVRLDLRMAIPKGYYGIIAARSGLASRYGILAFPGVIDAGYRGIVCVILFNFGSDCYKVEIGNRIAQLIIQKCYEAKFIECSSVEFSKFCETERGNDGFVPSLGF